MKCAIIHIADIHYRKNEPEGVSTVLKAFIKDVTKQKQAFNDQDFFLAIVGDLVNAGDDIESYSNFIAEFNQEFDDIGLLKDFRILVPGNHDVQQNIIEQNLKDIQKNYVNVSTTEKKFNDFICNKDFYEPKFENYELFESEFAKYGIDFSPQGKGWAINDEMGVYCLNTALGSLGGVNDIKDERKLAICTRGLVEWCNNNKTKTNILLMHHPISHLNDWSQDELKLIIEKNFTLCLCGHDHNQDILYNKISKKSLICSVPQLYTTKQEDLGYAIIFMENKSVEKIIYRQYNKGKFFNGSKFSDTEDGVVIIQNEYLKNKSIMEGKLKNALAFFKDQPEVFIEPKLSVTREFNDDENSLNELINKPFSTIIIAQPQFGLTCLAHYMILEAYKNGQFWIYLDSKHSKARNIGKEINGQLEIYSHKEENIKCIIIDSWNSSIIDHRNILNFIDDKYHTISIIIMVNYLEFTYTSDFDLSKLNTEFKCLHLLALQRNKVREFVSKYNQQFNIAREDEVVSKVTFELQALNIHRTPLNILTLLKVFEKNMNEDILNRTKLIKTVLFILFTDSDSFTYSSNKPSVDDCEYILGKFCKTMIEEHIRSFSQIKIKVELEKYCQEKLISVDVDAIINILEWNNIIIRHNYLLEFKHSYWIFYFAATYMLHDKEFMTYILSNKKYVNFPEIVEFYTGIDGRRESAIKILLSDLIQLVNTVNYKIGITEKFNPFDGVVWEPSKESIETIWKDISEIVEKSTLPTEIKDQYADKFYNSEAPYDQSFAQFLEEYSIISMLQIIKASSRALRNSNYVSTNLKLDMLQAVFNGWEQISKVIFLLSPTLALRGKAVYDGFSLILSGDFEGDYHEKLKKIYLVTPTNVVNHLKDDLSSKKNGPLIFEIFNPGSSEMQKHFISLYLIKEKPDGWKKVLFEHMNLLHRNSFYLGDIYSTLDNEIANGFISTNEINQIKSLMSIVVAKHKNAPKISKSKAKVIPPNMTLSKKNKLPLDVIIAARKRKN